MKPSRNPTITLRRLSPAIVALGLLGACGDEDASTSGAGGAGTGGATGGSAGSGGGGSGGASGSAGADAQSDAESDASTDGGDAGSAACGTCHGALEAKMSAGAHAKLEQGCLGCHQGALAHQANPGQVKAKVDFAVGLCGTCHKDHATTFLHSDTVKAGNFGGSIKTSKYAEFPAYKHLMGGHGFTLEYNEERAHAYLLKDHREIARKQNTVCLQCKSTPVTYYFNEQRRGQYPFSLATTWDQAIQSITANWGETLDYGTGCTHCHDPHGGGFRLVRKAMITSIMERGTDPYSATLNYYPKTPADLFAKMNEKAADGKLTYAAKRLAGTLTCAQCHVEYVCGPGIDKDKGVLRDDFPWRKLKDLEQYYLVKYNTIQDWKHAGTGLPGIKAQHPETEFYWDSKHYNAEVSCADCHMSKSGNTVNHFATSPFKSPETICSKCHLSDWATRVQTMKGYQDQTSAQAKTVEQGLDQVLTKIESLATDPTFDPQKLKEAKQLFMRALLWWEFTVVSENSMGAHNPPEAKTNLDTATADVAKAKTLLGL